MTFDQLPVNAFDLILVAVLALGLVRGRKHGMSEELMLLLKWLTIVVACAYVYEPAGAWLARSTPFSLLTSYIFVYLGSVLLILALFALVKHQIGGKLIGSDIFGRSEYYLGMTSGLVRFACILLAFLALLNARYFSRAEVIADKKYADDLYGADYFPGWHTAQEVVFERSLTGPWIRNNLGFLLIHPTVPEDKSYHQKEAQFP